MTDSTNRGNVQHHSFAKWQPNPLNFSLSSLSRVPLFTKISPEEILKLERSAEERQVRARQVVFLFGQRHEHVYLLIAGRVKLLRNSPNGREVTFGLVNPNELFADTGLFSASSTYHYSCEAIEESTVLAFRRTDFEAALESSGDSMKHMYLQQCQQRLKVESRLADFVFFDVTARLARLLVGLAGTYGRSTKIGTLLKLKITHQELANLIGSTRETTTLILSEFRRRGLIEFAGRKIVLVDPEQLGAIEGATYLHKAVERMD